MPRRSVPVVRHNKEFAVTDGILPADSSNSWGTYAPREVILSFSMPSSDMGLEDFLLLNATSRFFAFAAQGSSFRGMSGSAYSSGGNSVSVPMLFSAATTASSIAALLLSV